MSQGLKADLEIDNGPGTEVPKLVLMFDNFMSISSLHRELHQFFWLQSIKQYFQGHR